jgi:hypothetical protein
MKNCVVRDRRGLGGGWFMGCELGGEGGSFPRKVMSHSYNIN